MAKHKYEIATLSKANKDLALLIDEDLQKESELLQRLIKEVYEANQKVKESHLHRVQETQDKLKILNAEIENLSADIDQKDHATTIEQFNYLLKSKDEIFDALNTMRLFDSNYHLEHPLNTHMLMLKNRLLSLLKSEKENRNPLTNTYFEPLTTALQTWIDQLFSNTHATIESTLSDNQEFTEALTHNQTLENNINTLFATLQEGFDALVASRTHVFSTDEGDAALEDKINQLYETSRARIQEKMAQTVDTFNTKLKEINQRLETIEADTIEALQNKYGTRIDDEESTKESLQDDLKQLRFDIMSAEKSGDLQRLNTLMIVYEKKEKQNLGLYREKIKKLADRQTKSARQKLIKQRKQLELKHQEDLFKWTYQLESEKIKFTESRALFKVREDQKALENDKKVNLQWLASFKMFHSELLKLKNGILTFARAVTDVTQSEALSLMKIEINQLESLKSLKENLKPLELKLAVELREKAFDEQLFNVELNLAFTKTKENLRHQHTVKQLLKEKTVTEKNVQVDTIRAQEDAKSELIYQHALIEIAEKEHELQLLKIQSLYDSELDLTKSQAERLNIGIGVTETMVKTTVESQILFAKQQMKFAEKEYEARLENIERARSQELTYAQQKLASAQHAYQFNRVELEKERDQKLEDLSYRLALFTGQKDRKMLKEQEEKIINTYEERIHAVIEKENKDSQIIRYKKQIDAALKRANQAVEDALKLKDKTIETFEDLLEAGEEKLESFTSKQDKTLIPYIEAESTTTASERLKEALKEADEQLSEKIEGPKQRIDELNQTLETLAAEEEPKTQPIIAKIDAEMAKSSATIETAVIASLEDIDKIKEAREAFRAKIVDTVDHIEQSSKTVDHNVLKNHLIEQMKKRKVHSDQAFTDRTHKNEQTLRSRTHDIEAEMMALERQIDTAVKAFKRYLQVSSSAQVEKQRAVKKTLKETLKVNQAEINGKY